jgi:hypothetical protein
VRTGELVAQHDLHHPKAINNCDGNLVSALATIVE